MVLIFNACIYRVYFSLPFLRKIKNMLRVLCIMAFVPQTNSE